MIPIITDIRKLSLNYRAFVSLSGEPNEGELEECREKYQAVYDREPCEVVFYRSPDGLLSYYAFEIEEVKYDAR